MNARAGEVRDWSQRVRQERAAGFRGEVARRWRPVCRGGGMVSASGAVGFSLWWVTARLRLPPGGHSRQSPEQE